ncbi:Murein DD-endopeptidase MepM and murein hydrolase activator NlpD, contain LysM domain [Belliella buryatensis]|uniref:Murein DD-endopeptidase MepM and murein hydrolase activator NlpD, contain LysM domain n=1 Tax=Belliella buryatensis TaxID=1500549 RepID=A0A239DBN7_9BACT|nr:M23 family metallopeptidase [Belliella buryatensis]SNS29478.1 Murein DD-endopeptidase MepM and murein hydrolase activator NlpD, contain LysM domain [Belliella buryatensis]
MIYRKLLLIILFLSVGFTETYAQVFPKIIKKPTEPSKVDSNPLLRDIRLFDSQRFLQGLTRETDSLFFRDYVNIKKRLSIVSEDTLSLIWAPTNQLVRVSEQIQIDSIWVTAYEYFSSWDSQKINIYDFNPKDFKDTVYVKLYDQFFGTNWAMPLEETRITSEFGFRRYRWHHGTDLKLRTGDPIFSTFDGIVRIRSYDRNGYGYYVVVRHKNGLETLYGHMSKILVDVGQEVKAGDVLGLGGSTGRSTGPHLHYEVRYQGLSINPTQLFDFNSGRLRSDIYMITASSFDHVIEAQKSVYHRVRSGENLSVIARRYGVSVAQLTRLNNMTTRSVLRVGQNLRIR